VRDTAESALHLRDRVVRRGEEIRDEAAHRVTDAASALAGHSARETRGQNEAASA
jgi:cation transport regulator ChaB